MLRRESNPDPLEEVSMLSKSAARTFFLTGTAVCGVAFLLLTADTLSQFDDRTHVDQLSAEAKHGFQIWTDNNCMGCHTLLGEGSYYAPELTQVVARRGKPWIKAFLQDPQGFFPGRRKMVKYDFFDPALDPEADANQDAVIAFFEWVGNMETNGFPPEPDLAPAGAAAPEGDALAGAPEVYTTICIGCHQLGGTGGVVGPALDGVASRFDAEYLAKWIADPQAFKPGTTMPKLGLEQAQIDALVTFLSKQQ